LHGFKQEAGNEGKIVMVIEAVNTSLMKVQVKWLVLTVTDAYL
jgi:hypothetical protein